MVQTRYSPIFIVQSAQNIRNRMTTGQELLWRRLNTDQFAGIRFRRQHTIGNHVVDFYCRKLKLIILVDAEANVKCKEKDSYFNMCGYFVLRFTDNEIINNIPEVIAGIKTRMRYNRIKTYGITGRRILKCCAEIMMSPFVQKRKTCIADNRRIGLSVVTLIP